MIKFELYKNRKTANIVIDKTNLKEKDARGIRRVAQKVCKDVERVTGVCPVIGESLCRTENEVVVAVLGKTSDTDGALAAELIAEMQMDVSSIRGKRESFLFVVTEQRLLIFGSDKRGTIYGMFHISELMGVSPWVTFADVVPERKDEVYMTEADTFYSKEPSVKYRGFFINDEWPAFGNWTFSHFGGFTAEMYDMIFETLLRLKGNYLWPAMWTSSFSLDGPGEQNAILADEYGVVMSNSHHEPCLRHSEEWDKVRGEQSPYGNEWNYSTNREGLLNYWRDGLIRSGGYENIITIGMRGERDSSMLGEEASLKENIDLLKDIITEQRKLIRECVDNPDVPQMIALYKEVEAYFYGNPGKRDGLRDWEGLDGVTFMLCEDNFGNMRTLPTEELRARKGGWGMYYHFDYHGGPISYEWVNSSYLPKVWDQMTEAYEFGIRDIWIVNVGDLKFQEYPLSFFMDLAYDYEKWGIANRQAPQKYLKYWCNREFKAVCDSQTLEQIAEVIQGYTRFNHNCKPEAMKPDTYHPVHDAEAERQLERIKKIDETLEKINAVMAEEMQPAFWELLYYPAKASLNVQKLNLLAGLNHFYAAHGAAAANICAEQMKGALALDKGFTDTFHGILGGKWDGMALSKHIGFTNWNDEECKNPVRAYVDPVEGCQILAYVKGDGDTVTAGGAWTGKTLIMDCFERPGQNEGIIVLLQTGNQPGNYRIHCENPGISFSETEGAVEICKEIRVMLEREKLTGEMRFEICHENGKIPVELYCEQSRIQNVKNMTFIEDRGIISMEASHFAEKKETAAGAFEVLFTYGKTKDGIKAYPCSRWFKEEEAPGVTYRLWVREAGTYRLHLYCAPVNPMYPGAAVCCSVSANGQKRQEISLIPQDYRAGESSCREWAQMVLEQIRRVECEVSLQAGENTLEIFALSPGFLLEKLVLVREGKMLRTSYLGPMESFYTE